MVHEALNHEVMVEDGEDVSSEQGIEDGDQGDEEIEAQLRADELLAWEVQAGRRLFLVIGLNFLCPIMLPPDRNGIARSNRRLQAASSSSTRR